MADDRIALLVRDLGSPVQPDRDFREDLFETLVGEIDFEAGRPRAVSRGRVVRRPDSRRLRMVWIAAVVALLIATIIGAAILGQRLIRQADPLFRSQETYRHAPPFDISVESRGFVIRYRYDGSGLLRGDEVSGGTAYRSPGQWFVFDGRTYYEFDQRAAFTGAFDAVGVDGVAYDSVLGPTQPSGPLAWTSPLGAFLLSWPFVGDSHDPLVASCGQPARLADEVVIGRAAVHVVCDAPDARGEYWIDVATGLLLEVRPAVGSPATATSFVAPAVLPSNLFAIPRGPNGEPPVQVGAMPPGTYAVTKFVTPFTVTVGDGWFDAADRPSDGFIKGPPAFVAWFRPEQLVDPETGRDVPFSGTVDDLVAWFVRHPALRIGPRGATTVDGAPAVEFDLDVDPAAPLVPCDGTPTYRCVFLSSLPGVGHEQVSSSAHYRVVVLRKDSATIAFVINAEARADLDAGRKEIDGIHFR